MKKQFRVVVIGLYHRKVGGLDEFGYIYKIIFQTQYIVEEVLGKDGAHKKSEVTSILNLISDADLITKGRKQKKRLCGWILSDEVGIKSILENA